MIIKFRKISSSENLKKIFKKCFVRNVYSVATEKNNIALIKATNSIKYKKNIQNF